MNADGPAQRRALFFGSSNEDGSCNCVKLCLTVLLIASVRTIPCQRCCSYIRQVTMNPTRSLFLCHTWRPAGTTTVTWTQFAYLLNWNRQAGFWVISFSCLFRSKTYLYSFSPFSPFIVFVGFDEEEEQYGARILCVTFLVLAGRKLICRFYVTVILSLVCLLIPMLEVL